MPSRPESKAGLFVFDSVTIFDGHQWHENQSVIVDRGKFQEVGEDVRLSGESGERFRGDLTLAPGFIDCHVHLGFFEPSTVLSGGVTTARDLGWPAQKIFDLKKSLQTKSTTGPDLLAAGPMLTAPNGYPTRAAWAPEGTGVEVRSHEEVASAIESLHGGGADLIKLAQEPAGGPTLARELVLAVVAEANARGLRVASHVGSLDQLEIAVDSGVSELVHGLMSDETIPDAIIERMVAANMTLVPTLHIAPTKIRVRNVARFVEAGGRVVYGTDLGNAGPPPGIDLEELRLMTECGISVERVLASATSGAAEHLGLSDRGRIVSGADADLIALKGDDRKDVNALASLFMVMREGRRV